ncbi:hypothetical protein DFQ27_006239 [Actinomortierella ambigua]|uniref:SET domain-containing protein n=1 Tax=Actinomortierella ambigua TaxID=1343610 RepID=A0A9P6UC72_9FUNG|nr:hypothetical protein DFQ27_006239 [Actinomortierella ambigua]
MDDSDDNAQCPYCGTTLDGWEAFDIPVNEHQRRAPGCPFFAKRSTAPTKASAAKAHRKKTMQSTEMPEIVVSKTLLSPKSQKVHLHAPASKGQSWLSRSSDDPPPPPPALVIAMDKTRPGPSDMVPSVKNITDPMDFETCDLVESAAHVNNSTAPPREQSSRRRGGNRKAKDEGLRKLDEGMESDEFERLIQKPMKKPESKRSKKSTVTPAIASSDVEPVVGNLRADETDGIQSVDPAMQTKSPNVAVVIHQRKKRKTETLQILGGDGYPGDSGRSAQSKEADEDGVLSDDERSPRVNLASTAKGKGRKRAQPTVELPMQLSGEEDIPVVTKSRSKKTKEGTAKRTGSHQRKSVVGGKKIVKKKAPKAIIEIFPVDDDDDDEPEERAMEGQGTQAHMENLAVGPEQSPETNPSSEIDNINDHPPADLRISTPPSLKSHKGSSHSRSVSFETEPNAEIIIVDPSTPIRRAASRQDLEGWVDEVRPDAEEVEDDPLHVGSSVSSLTRRGMMSMITTKRRAGTFTPESRMDMSVINQLEMGGTPAPGFKTPTRPPVRSAFKTPTKTFLPSSTPIGPGASSPFTPQRQLPLPSTPFSVADILSLGQESRQANNTQEEPFVRTPIRKAMNPLGLEALELEGNLRQPILHQDHGIKALKLKASLSSLDLENTAARELTQEKGELVARRIEPPPPSPPRQDQPAYNSNQQQSISDSELEQVEEQPQPPSKHLKEEAQETEREWILRQANVTEQQLQMSVEEFHRAYIAEQVTMIEMAAEALIQRFEEEGERVKMALMGGSLKPTPHGLVLELDAQKYRKVVAARPLTRGTRLIASRPLCNPIVFPTHRNQHCETCFRVRSPGVLDLERCSVCKKRYYCSKECFAIAWKGWHRWICADEDLDDLDHEMLKMVVMVQEQLRHGSYKDRGDLTQQCGGETAALTSYVFDTLMGHSSAVPPAELDRYRAIALKVLDRLKTCKFPFKSEQSQRNAPTIDDLVTMLCRFHCNNFSIHDAQLFTLAEGTFPVGALFNHSCRPNAIVMYEGQIQIVVALEDIPVGQEVCTSYVDNGVQRAERRSLLMEKYYFDCQCPRCSEVDSSSKAPPYHGFRILDELLNGDKDGADGQKVDGEWLTRQFETIALPTVQQLQASVSTGTAKHRSQSTASSLPAPLSSSSSPSPPSPPAPSMITRATFTSYVLQSIVPLVLDGQVDEAVYTARLFPILAHLQSAPHSDPKPFSTTVMTNATSFFNTALENQSWRLASKIGLFILAQYVLVYPRHHPLIGLHCFTLAKALWNDVEAGLATVRLARLVLQLSLAILAVSHSHGQENRDLVHEVQQFLSTVEIELR